MGAARLVLLVVVLALVLEDTSFELKVMLVDVELEVGVEPGAEERLGDSELVGDVTLNEVELLRPGVVNPVMLEVLAPGDPPTGEDDTPVEKVLLIELAEEFVPPLKPD